jgi:hypothetical protein
VLSPGHRGRRNSDLFLKCRPTSQQRIEERKGSMANHRRWEMVHIANRSRSHLEGPDRDRNSSTNLSAELIISFSRFFSNRASLL